MKKNCTIAVKITSETNAQLDDYAKQLDITKCSLIRLLINRSLGQLKEAVRVAGGFNELIFELKPYK